MRMADKLLRRHNLEQAQVLGSEVTDNDVGHYKVNVIYTSTNKPAVTAAWMGELSITIADTFECKVFRVCNRPRQGEAEHYYTFYGIKDNAYAGAFGFTTAFNRIMALLADHKVPVGEYENKRKDGVVTCSRRAYLLGSKTSYCMGLANGLYDAYKANKKQEEEKADEVEVEEEEEEDREDGEDKNSSVSSALAMRHESAFKRSLEQLGIQGMMNDSRKYSQQFFRKESYEQGKVDSKTIQVGQDVLEE